jgi:hypothetical protein
MVFGVLYIKVHSVPVVASREHAGLGTPSPRVTAMTVRTMGRHITDALSDPIINQVASTACEQASPVFSLWWWVKQAVKFKQDDALILKLFGERDHYELLISPPVLLRMPVPQGDCDDFTMLLSALLICAGYRVRIVTIECDPRRPGEYSHVYAETLANGRWVPMDASHGKFPGWEVPAQDIRRKTSWSLDGHVVEDHRRFQ